MHVQRDLIFFEHVPSAARTEDFYDAYAAGLALTGAEKKLRQVHLQILRRFPRGTAAKDERLREARQEPDPLRAAMMYRSFLRDFKGDANWNRSAAFDLFQLMYGHQKHFTVPALFEAATQIEIYERTFARTSHVLSSYVERVSMVAEDLLEIDPLRSVDYCKRAEAFIGEQGLISKDVEITARIAFWPIELAALVKSRMWYTGVPLAQWLLQNLEDSSEAYAPQTEVKIRQNYAEALENIGAIDEAFRQLGINDVLDAGQEPALIAFTERHKELRPLLVASLAQWQNEVSLYTKKREMLLRDHLIAGEQHRPAMPFAMPTLDGSNTVSLDSFRGRPVILVFWASWCRPCHGELEALDSMAVSDAGARFSVIAVSIDNEKTAAKNFIARKSFHYPVLISNGQVDSFYQTETIPQVFVIDRNGLIRFQLTGYRTGDFVKKMQWMIEACESGYVP